MRARAAAAPIPNTEPDDGSPAAPPWPENRHPNSGPLAIARSSTAHQLIQSLRCTAPGRRNAGSATDCQAGALAWPEVAHRPHPIQYTYCRTDNYSRKQNPTEKWAISRSASSISSGIRLSIEDDEKTSACRYCWCYARHCRLPRIELYRFLRIAARLSRQIGLTETTPQILTRRPIAIFDPFQLDCGQPPIGQRRKRRLERFAPLSFGLF